jgi:hypothetical protein
LPTVQFAREIHHPFASPFHGQDDSGFEEWGMPARNCFQNDRSSLPVVPIMGESDAKVGLKMLPLPPTDTCVSHQESVSPPNHPWVFAAVAVCFYRWRKDGMVHFAPSQPVFAFRQPDEACVGVMASSRPIEHPKFASEANNRRVVSGKGIKAMGGGC